MSNALLARVRAASFERVGRARAGGAIPIRMRWSRASRHPRSPPHPLLCAARVPIGCGVRASRRQCCARRMRLGRGLARPPVHAAAAALQTRRAAAVAAAAREAT
eukprot:1852681-Prymnesium_polylepis.1